VLSIKCLPLKLQDLLSGKMQEFGSVEIIGDGRNICLKKAKIWKLTVRDVGELNFSDCEIGDIAVHHTASYRVKDSKIGKFVVVLEKADKPYRGYHVQDLKWEGGYTSEEVVKAFLKSAGAKPESIHETPKRLGDENGISANIKASGALGKLGLMQIYQILYTRSHIVQDAFLVLLKLQLLEIDPSEVFRFDLGATPLRYDLPYFSICDGQARYEGRAEPRPACEKYGVLELREPFSHLYSTLMFSHSEVRSLPVSMIAASSLFLTFAFYVGLAAYSGIAFAARHASRLMLSDRYFDLKIAPLTIGAIYGMLCVAPVGLIAVLMIMYA
jgi:hypothetical protein